MSRGCTFLERLRGGALLGFDGGQFPPAYSRARMADLKRARAILADQVYLAASIPEGIPIGRAYSWNLAIDGPLWFEFRVPELPGDARCGFLLCNITLEDPELPQTDNTIAAIAVHLFDSSTGVTLNGESFVLGPIASAYLGTICGKLTSMETNFLSDNADLFTPALLALHLWNEKAIAETADGLVLNAADAMITHAIGAQPEDHGPSLLGMAVTALTPMPNFALEA